MKISELSVDYVSFDDDDKEISGIAISYKDKNNQEERRWLEKPRRIGHWENIEIAKNTIRCSNCGHLRELKHFSEIIKRPKFCEMCGAKMDEEEPQK